MYVSTMMDPTVRNDGRNDADGGNDDRVETSNEKLKLDMSNEITTSSSSSSGPQAGRTKKDLSKMVWCKDGKTEHQAWLLEDTLEGKEKALVEWQTTGRRKLVPVSWIRFDIPRQRRRTCRAEINVKSFDGAAYGSRDEDGDDEKEKKGKRKRKRKRSTAQKPTHDSSNKKRKDASSAQEPTNVGAAMPSKKTKKRSANGNIDKENNRQRRRPSDSSGSTTSMPGSNVDVSFASRADVGDKKEGFAQKALDDAVTLPLLKEYDSSTRNSHINTASSFTRIQNIERHISGKLVNGGDNNRSSPLSDSSGSFTKVDEAPTSVELKSMKRKPTPLLSSDSSGTNNIYGSDSMKMPDRHRSITGKSENSSSEKVYKQVTARSIPSSISVDESLKTRATFASTFLSQKFLKKDKLGSQVDNASTEKDSTTRNRLVAKEGSDNNSSGRRDNSSPADSIVERKTTTRKRRPPAGLQQGARCIVKPIWPAFSSVSPGQYEVKFAKDSMEFLQSCLIEDITNLLEDVRVMKPEDVDSILKGEEPASDMVAATEDR